MLLAVGVQELAIYPTPATTEVPTLRNTIPPPPRFPSRIHRHEDKHTVPSKYYHVLLPSLLFLFFLCLEKKSVKILSSNYHCFKHHGYNYY